MFSKVLERVMELRTGSKMGKLRNRRDVLGLGLKVHFYLYFVFKKTFCSTLFKCGKSVRKWLKEQQFEVRLHLTYSTSLNKIFQLFLSSL